MNAIPVALGEHICQNIASIQESIVKNVLRYITFKKRDTYQEGYSCL